MNEGHCGLPEEELRPLAARLLEVPDDLIRTALDLELAEGTVVADTVEDTPCIFLGGLHRAERAIAGRLLGIAAGKLPWPYIDPDKALPWVERNTGLALAPGQADAVRVALSSKASVITGGPGVGKTTIVNSILRILSAKGVDILLCAPTGRAAKRMSEATGFEAKTIHRLLEVDPRTGGFRRDGENPLDCGLLAIDEMSMVDVMLMRALLAAVPDEAAMLIVGDVDQLPSVGPGQVLADVIASGAVPVVRLRIKRTITTKQTVDALQPAEKPYIAWDDRLAGLGVHIGDIADVAVVDLLVVVVLDLHHLVAGGKGPAEALDLPFARRVEGGLQFDVERAGAGTAPVHRAQHLDILHGIEAEALRNAGLDQLDDPGPPPSRGPRPARNRNRCLPRAGRGRGWRPG